MFVRIFGRSGCGKTKACYDIAKKAFDEGKKVYFVVPEQYAVSAEREIVAKFGNRSNINIEILNFKRMCNRVFREVGGLNSKLPDTASKLLALYTCADMLKSSLCEYKSVCTKSDFIKEIHSQINEFAQCSVTPASLNSACAEILKSDSESSLAKKLNDLSLIYSSYLSLLKNQFACEGNALDILAAKLHKNNFFKGSTVIFDSFYGFTYQECSIIKEIMLQANDTVITFMGQKNSPSNVFSRAENAAKRLSLFAISNNIDIEDIELYEDKRHRKNSALYNFEKAFSDEILGPSNTECLKSESTNVHIYSCKNIFEEAECASFIIKELVSSGKCRMKDIAVSARDLKSYGGIIDAAFEKHSIPYTLFSKDKVNTLPLCSAVDALFEMLFSKKSTFSLIKFLKTSLLGLGEYESDVLESYIRKWGISSYRFDKKEWKMNPSGYTEDTTEKDKEKLETINTCANVFKSAVLPYLEMLKKAETNRDFCESIYSFLMKIKEANPGLFEAEPEAALSWNGIVNTLDAICSVCPDTKNSAKDFYEIYSMSLEQYTYGAIPASLDLVSVSQADLMRAGKVKYVIMLGMNDTVFPANASESSIFSDKEKDELSSLGIELSTPAYNKIYDEYFLFYVNILSASENAFLTYSRSSLQSEELNISPLCVALTELTELKIRTFPENDEDLLISPISCLEAYSLGRNVNVNRALEKCFGKEFLEIKAFENPGYLSLYSDSSKDLATTATRLDSFCRCPFMHFGRYMLHLTPEAKAELGPLETGNIAHKILEMFCTKLKERKKNGLELFKKEDAAKEILSMLSEYISKISDKESVSVRFVYLYNRLSSMLVTLAQNLCEEQQVSDFAPADFELMIGSGKDGIESAPLELNSGEGNMRIFGRIDRVDTYEHGGKTYVRVVDYKTGAKVFDPDDIAKGMNLQMLLYLYSIWKMGKPYYKNDIVPAGILYIPCRRNDESISLGEEIPSVSDRIKTNGAVIDTPEILHAMDNTHSGKYIPVKYKADGTLYKSSSAVSVEEFNKMLSNSAKAALYMANEIKGGNIKVNPYKYDDENSCANCELISVCGFENGKSSCRYKPDNYLDDTKEDK